VAKPLIDIISMFVPQAYEKSLGEMFYNESIVSLLHLLDVYTNKFNLHFNPELGTYENSVEPQNAFKSLNLDLNTVSLMINELLGDENGQNNIFSRVLRALGTPDETPGSFAELTGFNLKAVLETLGMNGESSFKKDQFAGIVIG